MFALYCSTLKEKCWGYGLMKGKIKNIKFSYYEVVCDGDDTLYDLHIWMSKILKKPLLERKKTVNGIQGRLENVIELDENIYAFNFMRLDVSSNSYKVKETKNAEHIDLADDEYMGTNTVALYDAEKHIIMIQKNRGSYTANGIQNYINDTNQDDIVYFRPILNNFNVSQLKHSRSKKLIVRCSDTREFRTYGNPTFERIIETCGKMSGCTFYVEIGVGREKTSGLDNDTVYEAAETILKNKHCVSNAKAVLDDDKIQGVFELFDNWKEEIIPFTVPERGELSFEFVAGKMYERYSQKETE